jgi:HEAT repeat protein
MTAVVREHRRRFLRAYLPRLAVATSLFCAPLVAQEECSPSSYIHYLAAQGRVDEALAEYRQLAATRDYHDSTVIRRLAEQILEQGVCSPSPEDQVMALLGAGISEHPSLLPLLRRGLSSLDPQVQLLSIHLLANQCDEVADDLLNRAVLSPHIAIRLEAIYQLAKRRYPSAQGQIEAIMARLPEELHIHFPELFAMIGDSHSDARLRQFLADDRWQVRCAAILALAKAERGDFVPQIRRLAAQLHLPQQEAAAAALGMLGDEQSVTKLEQLARSSDEQVKLASLRALWQLGRLERRGEIEEMALAGNLYAIATLGEVADSKEALAELLDSDLFAVRAAAAVSLLQLADPRGLPIIGELLVEDARRIGLSTQKSVGGALHCLRVVSTHKQKNRDDPIALELSRQLREQLLVWSRALPECAFLSLAERIIEAGQNDLIPLLALLLENLGTERAIALLKKGEQQAGAPLVRGYCNLALYRLELEGPWEANLLAWVEREQHADLIQLRPVLSFRSKKRTNTRFQLTSDEVSQLLVESLEALARQKNSRAITAILNAMEYGNPHNRFALAGLLTIATAY